MRFFKTYKLVFFGVMFLISLQGFKASYPNVYVIGDSISMHYGPYLKNALTGFFNYGRKSDSGEGIQDLDTPVGTNGGDSAMVLAFLKELKNDGNFKTDYLLINCGLHDIKRKSPTDTTQVSLKNYNNNIKSIIRLSKKMKVKLIWINSTPVVDTIHNKRVSFFRFENDLIAYNKIADSLMKKANVPIINLFSFTKKFIPNGYLDHVHYKEDIRKQQADFIAGNLTAILNCNRNE